jgi:hypothetical protein
MTRILTIGTPLHISGFSEWDRSMYLIPLSSRYARIHPPSPEGEVGRLIETEIENNAELAPETRQSAKTAIRGCDQSALSGR